MSYKPGTVIGDYVVAGAVGTGGMGTVYKVQHVITQRIEAMKLLAAGHTEAAQEQRFLREMQVQARLHHPNIAAVYNAFRYYDEFFLVMEFIDGESLESILNRGRLPLELGLDYARQALFALGYAHAHGVVHRDIAPSNMIVTVDGTVKLTDFGLAKTATDIRLTHSGTPMGSPWYMSPEQVRGDAAMDARSDIYSLGVVLYEIVTGSKLFDLASTFDVMRAHVEMPPPAPSERAADVPPELERIILTALAKDPNARFQSAEQFYAELEALQIGGEPAPGHASIPAAAGPGAVPAMPSRKSWPPTTARRKPRFAAMRVAQAAAGTAACGLVLFGGYATSAYLRNTPAALPALMPAKAEIPPAPDFQLPPAPATSSLPPVEASAVRTPPAPRKFNRSAVRPLVAPAFTPPASSELPPPPSHLTTPGPGSQAVALPSLAPPPVISGPAVAVRRNAPNPVNLVEPPPEPAAEPATEKKHGNRFLRALHKVVPFHREESSGEGAVVTGP